MQSLAPVTNMSGSRNNSLLLSRIVIRTHIHLFLLPPPCRSHQEGNGALGTSSDALTGAFLFETEESLSGGGNSRFLLVDSIGCAGQRRGNQEELMLVSELNTFSGTGFSYLKAQY